MNTFKTIAASLLAVAFVGTVSATTVTIKITGSTAFRKADYFAIVDSLNNPQIATTATGGDMTGDAQAVIVGTGKSGTTYSGDTVVVQTAFQGSVAGVNAVANGLNTIPGATFTNSQTWISAGNVTSSTPVAIVNEGAGTITGFTSVPVDGNGNATVAVCDGPAAPNATFSDSFQSSTPYTTPALGDENPSGLGVGVVEFFWVKEKDTAGIAANLTNISSQQSSLLLSAGELPLSYVTGNTSDASTDIILVGRNNDSGTRLDDQAEAETSAGAYGFGQTPENQYQPVLTSSLVSGVNNVGDAGYSSGSKVAAALDTAQASGALDDASNHFIFVGYLGQSDEHTAAGLGATPLTFNGVAESTSAVESGSYSFWSYEHLYFNKSSSVNPAPNQGILNSIGTQLRTVEVGQSGIPISGMLVNRGIEGGLIAPN